MRLSIVVLFALPLTGCFQAPDLAKPTSNSPVATIATEPTPAAVRPSPPAIPPRVFILEISGVTLEGVAFDSRSAHLVVADQSQGPGSQFTDAAEAASSIQGIAAINAGFFTPEGAPLGLIVSSGKSAGSWNSSSSLGSGIWYQTTSGSAAIARRENLGRSRAATTQELMQAGPLLVENGRAVSGLEATKSSVRTVILSDGATRWWIGRSSPCTLATLSQVLASAQPAGWPVHQALNLDGGRSSDLWVSEGVSGGPLTRRAPWNRPVRNFLVLKKH